jgi:hypothetical protein
MTDPDHAILLVSAMRRFEQSFAHVVHPHRHDNTVPLCWSGGLTDFGKTPPVLYPTAERAIKAWERVAMSSTGTFHKLEWFQKPELQEMQVTIAVRGAGQRLTDNKFTVKSQFVVYSNE